MPTQMKKIIPILLLLIAAFTVKCQRNDTAKIRQAVVNQLNTYPESTLQDIYKYFYQEHFGPEHLISDTAAARIYLLQELALADSNSAYYEPIGINGDYVRVHLNAVTDGIITADELLNALITSANEHRIPSTDWESKWKTIVSVIQAENIEIEGLEDKPLLDEAARHGQAVHHSRAYNEAYHPHYRIVSRSLIPCRNAASHQAE